MIRNWLKFVNRPSLNDVPPARAISVVLSSGNHVDFWEILLYDHLEGVRLAGHSSDCLPEEGQRRFRVGTL